MGIITTGTIGLSPMQLSSWSVSTPYLAMYPNSWNWKRLCWRIVTDTDNIENAMKWLCVTTVAAERDCLLGMVG